MTLTWRVGTDFYTDEFKDYFAIGSRNQPTGSNQDYMSYVQNTNSDLLLNFRKDFGSMIKTSLTLGQNMYNYSFKSVSGTANGLEIPNFYEVNNTANQTTFSTVTKYRTAALFGELALQYGDMLFVTGTLRNDWSTTMPEDNLSDLYPSGSVGFVFTEIPGLKGNTVLPFGKLRVSYASIANIAGPENTLTYFVAGGASDGWVSPNGLNFPLLGFSGFTLSNGLGNSDLRHEAQNSFEVGVDLRFFNNRFSVDFAYFNNQNEDLLLSVPIAASTGYTSLFQNAGSMESVGFEILSNIVPVQTPNFQWDLTVNFNKYTNTVLELAPGVDNLFLGGFVDPQIRAVADQEYPTIYGYDYWRDDNGNLVINDDPDDAYPDGFPMGNYVLVPIGQVNPDWVMGITNSFTLFKSLSISGLLEIKEGGLMWNGTRGALRYFGAHADTETRDDPTFVFDGVKGSLGINEDGEEVVITNGEPNDQEVTKDVSWYALGEGSGFTGPTMTIEESSWVRLRELTVSYNLPPSILNNTFLDKVEIYFTGRNLFLSTPYEGIDPETNLLGSSNAQGMDYFNMPGTKSYSFGLRLGF
jgi:hypothetical protein